MEKIMKELRKHYSVIERSNGFFVNFKGKKSKFELAFVKIDGMFKCGYRIKDLEGKIIVERSSSHTWEDKMVAYLQRHAFWEIPRTMYNHFSKRTTSF